MSLKNTREDSIFASILSDGKIHVASVEGAEGAVKREYETSDGKKGSKWELLYSELGGKITEMNFRDGDFGQQLFVKVQDGEEKPVILTLATSSSFCEDFMKKVFNINMEEPVILAPYAFQDDKGKSKKGISISQGGNKITNYFYDAEKKENTHDYPVVPKPKGKKPISKEEWKLWFAQCRIFLVDKMTEHFKLGDDKAQADKDYDAM